MLGYMGLDNLSIDLHVGGKNQKEHFRPIALTMARQGYGQWNELKQRSSNSNET